MLRGLLAFAVLGAALVSQALTLQGVTKWGPSLPLAVSYQKIVDTGTGYVIAGDLDAQYVAVVKTDYSGNLIRSGLYEPGPSFQTYVSDLEVDASGRVYLLTGSHPSGAYGRTHVACLDGNTLTTKWQKAFDPKPMTVTPYFRGRTMAVRGGVGIEAIFFAHSSGEVTSADDKVEYVCWDANGTQLFAGSQDDGDNCRINDSLAFPAAGGGFAIGGAVADRAIVYKITDAGMLGLKAHNPNAGSSINKIMRNGAEIASAGMMFANGGFHPAAFRFDSVGSMSSVYDPNTGTPIIDMAQESGDLFILLSNPDSVTYKLHRFNRSSGALTTVGTYNEANPNFLVTTSGGRAFVNGGFKLQQINLGTGSLVANMNRPETVLYDAVPNQPLGVFAVGGMADTHHGYTASYDTSIRGATQMYVSAYNNRLPRGSAVDPAGARYVTSLCFDSLSRETSTVTKFSPTGTVLWLRQIAYNGDPDIEPIKVLWSHTDSTVLAVGRFGGTIIVAKLNSTNGAISSIRKTIAPGYHLTVNTAAVGTDGVLWVAGEAVTDGNQMFEFVYRFSPAGVVLSSNFSAPQATFAQTRFIHQLSANRWAIVKGAGGSGDGGRVSFFDNSGTPLSDYDFDTTSPVKNIQSTVAPNGDLVVGVLRNGTSEIRRFSATTGASVMNATLIARKSYLPFAVGAGPNGNCYLVAQRFADTVTQLDAVTPAGGLAWAAAVVPVLDSVTGLVVDANDWVYVMGDETPSSTTNTYLVRYLGNGVRSAQRRVSGYSYELGKAPGNRIDVVGMLFQTARRAQVSLARYTSP